jgi:hypothetical protein
MLANLDMVVEVYERGKKSFCENEPGMRITVEILHTRFVTKYDIWVAIFYKRNRVSR